MAEKLKLNLDKLGTVHRKGGKVYLEVAEDVNVFEGKKGNYVDIIRWENKEPDQFGQVSSYQVSQPKESTAPKRYVGNGSPLGQKAAAAAPAQSFDPQEGDLPF